MFLASHKTRPVGWLLVPVALLAVAGCGGSSGATSNMGTRVVNKIVYLTNYLPYKRNPDGTVSCSVYTRMYTMSPDGTGQKWLTQAAGKVYDVSPSLSYDGSKIVFLSNRENCGSSCQRNGSGYEGPLQLWVMNADGSQPRRITATNAPCAEPVFSPDGSKILYSAEDALWIINADGGTPRRIAQGRSYVTPSFSPDGTKILFSDPAFMRTGVFLMNADGTDEKQLAAEASQPSFSPDGSKIVYCHRPEEADALNTPSWICVMNADGTGKTQLTNEAVFDSSPSFSPDGTKILFNRSGDFHPNKLFVMNADGTNLTPIPARSDLPVTTDYVFDTVNSHAWR